MACDATVTRIVLDPDGLPLDVGREQRIVPQIQGPYYRNFYGGKRHLGVRHPHGWHEWNKKKFYQGYHFTLDVF